MSAGIITALQDLIVEIRTNGCDAAGLGELQQIHNLAGQAVREGALMAKRSERWAVEGFSSPGRWVASHTGLPTGRAKAILREAESLEHMPHSQAAARQGLLDDARVQLLTGCQRTDSIRYDAEVDAMLVGLDGHRDLMVAARRWKECAGAVNDPDPAELADPPAEEPEWVRLTELLDGRGRIEGELNATNFAIVQAAFDKLVNRYLNNRRNGDPSLAGAQINQLRAQALVDLCDFSLREPRGTATRSDRYRVNLVVRVGQDGSWDPETPVPPEAMCDSAFTRTVLSAQGEVLDVGRATRSWPDAIANAIRLRDRHCTFPGCDRPASWNDVHHCLDWNLGGETKITNGALLCRWHHTYIHRHHWTVRLDVTQKPIFRRPDGSIHQHHPAWPQPQPPMCRPSG
ncbi:MAG: DUF222 domain-containing protein [Acidimicrobiales bacterium]